MKRLSNTRLLAGVFLCTALLFACAKPPQTRALLAEPAADLPAAALSASYAARLAPLEANYRDTVKEIRGLAGGSDNPHCLPVDCQPAAEEPGG